MEKHAKVFMTIARLWANESHCERNKVGAVLVKNGEVFAHGYNGTLMGDDNSCEEPITICPKCGRRLVRDKDAVRVSVERDNEYYKVTCPACKHERVLEKRDFPMMTKDGIMHAEQNAILFSARDGKSTKGATMYVTTSPCINCASMIFHAGITKVVYKDEYKDKRGIELLKRKGVEVVKFDEETEIDLESLRAVSVEEYEKMYEEQTKRLLNEKIKDKENGCKEEDEIERILREGLRSIFSKLKSFTEEGEKIKKVIEEEVEKFKKETE